VAHETTQAHPLPPEAVDVSFEQTVPRAIAHRQAVGEVFVTDSVQIADDEFLLGVQLPRAHSLWFDRRVRFHDPVSTAEAARQSVFVVIHRHLGVPVGLPFSLQRMQFAVADLAAYEDDEASPLQGRLRLRVTRQGLSLLLGGMSIDGELTIGDAVAMTLSGDIVFMPRADYDALRSYRRARKPLEPGVAVSAARPLEPAAVGRLDPRNVVIAAPERERDSAGATRYPLVIDRRHPSFFDHAYDHVPGPLIVEAWRQAAIVTAHAAGALPAPVAAVTGCEFTFTDFGEFEGRVECSALLEPATSPAVRVGLHQFGEQIAAGRIELRPYP
jgi:hypothetical protein